jgi:hypothetical protein
VVHDEPSCARRRFERYQLRHRSHDPDFATRGQALRFAEATECSWRECGVGKWLGLRGPHRRARRARRDVLDYLGGYRARVDRLGASAGGLGAAVTRLRSGAPASITPSRSWASSRSSPSPKVHNARSRAVMERLGMRYVRRILRPGLIVGSAGVHEAAPFALYRITRSAYGAQQPQP